MLTDQDIQKLTSVLATKDAVQEVNKKVDTLQESVQTLVTSIDGLVKRIDDLHAEYAAVSEQLTRHEEWIKEIAEKVGIDLKY